MTIKRLFNFTLAIFALPVLAIPITVTWVLLRLTSIGPVLYWSDLVGIHNTPFKMPKFRTMQICTLALVKHSLENP